MQIVFFLDNNEYVVVEPEKLHLRAVSSGQAALGIDVLVPLRNEDGTPKMQPDGKPETSAGFRPLVNYAVNLMVPGATTEEDIKNLTNLLKEKKKLLKQELKDKTKPKTKAKKA